MIPTLFIVTILVFLSIRFIPGDIIDIMMGDLAYMGSVPIDREALEHRLGLDVPILPILIGGAVIMENIFNLPGLGGLILDALEVRNYPLVSGINLLFATAVVGINLIIDLIYAYLDPRVRYE